MRVFVFVCELCGHNKLQVSALPLYFSFEILRETVKSILSISLLSKKEEAKITFLQQHKSEQWTTHRATQFKDLKKKTWTFALIS